MSFALYELMRNPDLSERIAAEADALFAGGDPAAADLDLKAIDVTHRFVMENLRLHPVIPVHNRTAATAFEVDGSVVPARSAVLVAFPAAHFMAENFEEPDRFDIDRYLPPRSEHRKRGAYQPFGVGTHLCLGQRFTELMMVANLLLVAHHLELEMVPANYRLKLSPLPKFSPGRKFGFRVRRVRNPFSPASGGSSHVH
ncbi:MAG: cytochrome P450 [Gammaproteobacteria bacterium]|nr:cytochrome P450 [Gammaproteobacteria bacterium]